MDQIFIGGEVMMGLQRFIRDLTKSWYFRVWILLFAICGLVWFIGLGFLADKSENDYKHLKYEFSVHDYSKKGIRFPDFQFKVPVRYCLSYSFTFNKCILFKDCGESKT